MCFADVDDPDANTCVGNVYSAPVQVKFEGASSSKEATIVADKVLSSVVGLSVQTPTCVSD